MTLPGEVIYGLHKVVYSLNNYGQKHRSVKAMLVYFSENTTLYNDNFVNFSLNVTKVLG